MELSTTRKPDSLDKLVSSFDLHYLCLRIKNQDNET